MTEPGYGAATEAYSPKRRTALVLSGIGTAGAYHAGVLRALHESGVKIDLVAGRGIGALGALFAAVDGGQRLWDEGGFWRAPAVTGLYPWRHSLIVTVCALGLSVALVVAPLTAMALGLVVFPIDFLVKMTGIVESGGLTAWYMRMVDAAFAPTGLPTWLPRLVLLVLGAAVLVAAVSGGGTVRGRVSRGGSWWRLVSAPLASEAAVERCWNTLWDLVRGAASLARPSRTDLGRRYVEMLSDNLGQPGFRELMIVAHDIDASRDLVFALLSEPHRRDLLKRRAGQTVDRRADVMDLAGVGRDHLEHALGGALAVPLATEFDEIPFGPDEFWRGERHRLCDRPACLGRILDELTGLNVEQVLLVSAAAESPGPHALTAPRLDARGRLGEYLQSTEVAAVRDITSRPGGSVPRVFTIRPIHNPVGPLDFAGGFDDRSSRRQTLLELMTSGYEDAYRQFIEPVVGASGDRVGLAHDH